MRPLRIEFEGAWYHVMNRGLARRRIFSDGADRRAFLQLLEAIWRRFGVEIHAYCLMDNHYHLLVRTPAAGLGRAMRHLNGVYTQGYNRRHGRDGPLFRGRYKAVLVDAEAYWLHLSRYVHRNPLEARRVEDLRAYPWSSYPCYVDGRRGCPEWLVTGEVLGGFPSRQAYRRFVETETVTSPMPARHDLDWSVGVLGDKDFRARMLAKTAPSQEIPARQRRPNRPTIKQIIAAAAQYYGEAPSRLRQPIRGRGVRTPAKAVALYLGQEFGYKLNELAGEFGLSSYASAGAAIRNLRQRLQDDPGLRDDIKYILQDLKIM